MRSIILAAIILISTQSFGITRTEDEWKAYVASLERENESLWGAAEYMRPSFPKDENVNMWMAAAKDEKCARECNCGVKSGR